MFNEILLAEEDDIVEQEIRKRQEWIQEFKEQHGGKPPEKIEKYHERKNLAEPLSPEEEEKKRLEDEEKAKKKKDKGKGGAKKKESKGKKGKKGKDEKGKQAVVEVGPSEVVMKFDGFYEDYENQWAKRDETHNPEQLFDRVMLRDEVLPQVQKSLTK